MVLLLASIQTLPTLTFLTSTIPFFSNKSTKKCKKEEKGVSMQDIVSRLVAVLIAVNRSAIRLHTIATERAISCINTCTEKNGHVCCEEWCGSKRAAQKEGFESGCCFNNQCYGGHDHHDEF